MVATEAMAVGVGLELKRRGEEEGTLGRRAGIIWCECTRDKARCLRATSRGADDDRRRSMQRQGWGQLLAAI